jgi:phosphatidylserine/phosphatidylglycerophosphate/cardiolipin synthase-like enzyme
LKDNPLIFWKPAYAGGRWALWLFLASSLVTLSPAYAGDSVTSTTTLLRNQEYSEALLQRIDNARESILCSFYLFKIGEGRANQPRRIADELIRARRRGVEVIVILEISAEGRDPLNEDNRHTAALLTGGGIKVFFDSPQVITHNKVVVIDRRYLFLGSHNLTQAALRHNNELSVLIDSPELAAQARTYLERQ